MRKWKPVPLAPRAPQLVVVDRPGAAPQAYRELLSKHWAGAQPLFHGHGCVFHKVSVSPERMEELSGRLREHDEVEAAYVKPAAYPAAAPAYPPAPNEMEPAWEPAPLDTPDLTPDQGYLDAAPRGVDARYAWSREGGGGEGIAIIDIEGAWHFAHEDLAAYQDGLAGGNPPNDPKWRDHGTAVFGVLGGDRNGSGVTGICPEAGLRAISVFGEHMGTSAAIWLAADLLAPGDILLIEMHQPGPRFGFDSPSGQRGYIPVEWWPDNFTAIQHATSKGILVVEAAANGAEDLDDAIYNASPAPPFGPFPAWWKNPFQRLGLDSGAILVGAGAPADRSRLNFSNFGSMLDAQGWGQQVTTTGYGDFQGGDSEDRWYTHQFSGTSSAAAMVAGALGCVQGALRAGFRAQLGPTAVRQLLRSTGSPQTGPSRIGSLPDLRQILNQLL